MALMCSPKLSCLSIPKPRVHVTRGAISPGLPFRKRMVMILATTAVLLTVATIPGRSFKGDIGPHKGHIRLDFLRRPLVWALSFLKGL